MYTPCLFEAGSLLACRSAEVECDGQCVCTLYLPLHTTPGEDMTDSTGAGKVTHIHDDAAAASVWRAEMTGASAPASAEVEAPGSIAAGCLAVSFLCCHFDRVIR